MERAMKGFKFIDGPTSDVMFEAYGKTPAELFSSAAEAMFSIICKIKKVEPNKAIKVEIKAKNLNELLYKWLSELIALVDIHEMFFSKFEITEISERHLKAVCLGNKAEPEKGQTVVKAVLYYGFNIEKTKAGYTATIGCDI